MADAEDEVGTHGQDATKQADDDGDLPLLSTGSSHSLGGNFLPDLVVVFPLKIKKTFSQDEVKLMLQSIVVKNGEVDDIDSHSALGQLEQCGRGATLQEVSDALYDSLTVYLAIRGCRMKTVKSCNDDALFLLISLGDSKILAQHDKNARAVAHAQRHTFQTKFTMTNAREKLDLKQTMRSELEAAYLEFNQQLVNNAKQEYGRFKVEGSGQEDDGDTIFKQYSDGIAGLEGSFMRTVDRIRLLTGLLQGFVDLNHCLSWGLIVTHYGIHSKTKVEEFCMGQPESPDQYRQGHVPWANVNPIQMLATVHPDHGPPIQEIRDYFGEKAAFYFLWLTHTARALVWWAPFGAFFHLALWLKWSDGSIVAPILVCVWAQVYLKSWNRLEGYYSELWGVASSTFEQHFDTRPDYRGDWVPHPLNETELTKAYKPWKSWCCGLVANAVAFACASLCVASTVFLRQHEKVFGTFWMEKLLSLQILSSQLIWNALTPALVDLRTPRPTPRGTVSTP